MLRRLLPWVVLGTLIALFVLNWRLGAVACFVVLLAVGHHANRQEEQQKAAQDAELEPTHRPGGTAAPPSEGPAQAQVDQAVDGSGPQLPAATHGYAVVDLETTGLSPADDRVVEVAIVHVDTTGLDHLPVVQPGQPWSGHHDTADQDPRDHG
jgi:hypothetical protein